jgi:uncharacterized protein (DUF2147 family)
MYRTGEKKCAVSGSASLRTVLPIAAAALLLGGPAAAQTSPEGLWKTFDDHTGEARALVRVYRQGDAFFGRVEATLVPGEEGQHCTACTDERKDQPVVGMVVMRGLKPDEDGFAGGDILDPESGSVYRCLLRLEEDGKQLIVRGYLGLSLFGRSQTWRRAE